MSVGAPVAASRRRGDLGLWIVATVGLVQALFFIVLLTRRDLIGSYPFDQGDAHDWLSAGLHLAGQDVRDPSRPPLLPLLIAVLDRVSALALVPWINQLCVVAAALLLYATLRRVVPPLISVALALTALLQNGWLWLSVGINGDVLAATLLFAALVALLRASDGRFWYVLAGLLGGLSAIAQQTAMLLPLPVALFMVLRRRRDLRCRELLFGGFLFAAPILSWFAIKQLRYGVWGDVGTAQWALLELHFDALTYYLAVLFARPGWPILILATAGVLAPIRRHNGGAEGRRCRDSVVLFAATAAAVLGFFVFWYDWRSPRFVHYAMLPLLVLAGLGLKAWVPRRAVRVLVLGVSLLWAVWPLSGGEDERWLLWPVPPIEGVGLLSRQALLARVGGEQLSRDNVYSRVLRAARRRFPDRSTLAPDAESYASAVLLYVDGDPGDLGRLVPRLGNLLRRRARAASLSLYPAGWWGWSHVTAMPSYAGYALFAIELPGLEPVLLAIEARNRSAIEARLQAVRGVGPAPPPPGFASQAAAVGELAGWLGVDDTLLGLVACDRDWARLLPFEVRTTYLVIVSRRDTALLEAIEDAPQVGQDRGGLIAVRKVSFRGRQGLVALPLRAEEPLDEAWRVMPRGRPPDPAFLAKMPPAQSPQR